MQLYDFEQSDDLVLGRHVLKHGNAPEAQGQHGQPVGIWIFFSLT